MRLHVEQKVLSRLRIFLLVTMACWSVSHAVASWEFQREGDTHRSGKMRPLGVAEVVREARKDLDKEDHVINMDHPGAPPEMEALRAPPDDTISRCYLDRPRIHFAGRFRSDVSTINNCYDNYGTDEFKIIDGTVEDNEHARFNPRGTGVFNFHNVTVTSVCPATGPCTTDDPLVKLGIAIDTVLSGGSGKMADLDVEYQMSSLLYGLKIGISLHQLESGVVNKQAIAIGDYHPVGFKGIWGSATNAGGDAGYSATYQSVIENLSWNDERLDLVYPPGSRQYKHGTLRVLRDRSPLALSISFTTYGYEPDSQSHCYTYGYVVGTIGISGDPSRTPIQYVRGRLLNPTSDYDTMVMSRAPFLVRDSPKKLIIDFGNSVKRYTDSTGHFLLNTTSTGSQLCLRVKGGGELGRVDLTDEWYSTTAGVYEIDLTDNVVGFRSLHARLLQVVDSNCNSGSTVFLEESLYHVRPTGGIFGFMDPDDKIEQSFFVTHHGLPVPKHPISVAVTPYHTTAMCSQLDPAQRGSYKRCQCPYKMTDEEIQLALKGLKVNGKSNFTVFTNDTGEATITLTAGDPGKIRKYVDGMVYLVSYLPHDDFAYNYNDGPLVVRVFDNHTWEGEPQWFGKNGVHPIFKQYENLYPSMRNILSMGNYYSILEGFNIKHLNLSMRSPKTAAGHMPVTRDLSRTKRDMILQWLNRPTKGRRDNVTIEELRDELQLALQVEFYTIPTYAYALYSIKVGANQEIAELIASVLVEEMGHLAIVANILNAIGGKPQIFDKDFVPVFPSRLPGGIEPDLLLRLAPLSLDLVRTVFMTIETPTRTGIDSDSDDIHNDTIGCFYARVRRNMVRLEEEAKEQSKTIFTGDPARQVNYGALASPVTNLKEAKEGIRKIVSQGEGSSQLNPTDKYEELAHYYKFAEIVHGRRLFKKPNGNWDYVGTPITFEPNGVWPLAVNPKVADYPIGSRARMLAEDFSRLYLQMLRQLQIAFNGSPEELDTAVANMFLLRMKAREMAETEIRPGVHAGPTFENPLRLKSG